MAACEPASSPGAHHFGHIASKVADTVRRFLDLSTGHLPREERAWLDQACRSEDLTMPVSGFAGSHGWFVHVSSDPDHASWEPAPALQRVFARARAHGCDYVLFDADGPVDPDLPFFPED